MGEFRSIAFLFIGVIVGWSAARYQGGAPKISISTSQAAAEDALAASGSGTCSGVGPGVGVGVGKPVEKAADSSANFSPTLSPTLFEQMSHLKIADLHKYCDDAETKFLDNKMPSKGIYELPQGERDALIGEWSRRFSDLMINGFYWRAQFVMEFGGDVVSMDLMMDLQSNTSDRYKCAAWTVYYEINGKPNPDSYFSQSSCDGSGFRKKGDHFYFDINTYSFAGIGKHITILLLPMPGGGGAEYLGGDADKWLPVPQFNWQKSSIIEFSQLQQRFQQKVDQLGEP